MRIMKVKHKLGSKIFTHKVEFKTLRDLKKILKPLVETHGPVIKMIASPERFDEIIKEINGD